MSAETFDAPKAQALGLVQHCVAESDLLAFTLEFAQKFSACAPEAVLQSKRLVDKVAGQPINDALLLETATLIAQKRVSAEGQDWIQAFLAKGR